jgi:AcrR family transcriptional regulator
MKTAADGPRRRGRPPKGERDNTRQDLIDAALSLFSRQGYAATTVRQIAEAVGVRDSAIYAHFNAKTELLEALIYQSDLPGIESAGLDVAMLGNQNPSKALPEFVDRIVLEWDKAKPRALVSLLSREGFEHTTDVLGNLRSRLIMPFEQWVDSGWIRNDVPVKTLLWQLTLPLAAIRILYLNAHSSPHRRKEGRRLAREHVDYFLMTASDTTN